ncbi:hypothetical protein [Hyalangium sp.]|uniref:hypothetical protein n=1 Tax=Hyalangium sp. TaxID=2028555 RepID=UPI002D66B8A6|nr:hypothetical protein [Hyalangium sp.]HYI00655.1 hypothetical protein [Hyalangium sp.]
MEQLASGQKLIIKAILVYLATMVLITAVGSIAVPLGGLAFGLGFLGVIQIVTGLRMPMTVKLPMVLFMFVPLVGLIVLLILNSRATSALRAAGYRVGFFGASK